jgi:hypothetical protein
VPTEVLAIHWKHGNSQPEQPNAANPNSTVQIQNQSHAPSATAPHTLLPLPQHLQLVCHKLTHYTNAATQTQRGNLLLLHAAAATAFVPTVCAERPCPSRQQPHPHSQDITCDAQQDSKAMAARQRQQAVTSRSRTAVVMQVSTLPAHILVAPTKTYITLRCTKNDHHEILLHTPSMAEDIRLHLLQLLQGITTGHGT